MSKNDHDKILSEMKQLYFEKDFTIKQIADYYKLTRQNIYQIFKRSGVKLHKKKWKVGKFIDREILIQLYVKEKLPVLEIARRLGISHPTLSKELKRHGIERRIPWQVKM